MNNAQRLRKGGSSGAKVLASAIAFAVIFTASPAFANSNTEQAPDPTSVNSDGILSNTIEIPAEDEVQDTGAEEVAPDSTVAEEETTQQEPTSEEVATPENSLMKKEIAVAHKLFSKSANWDIQTRTSLYRGDTFSITGNYSVKDGATNRPGMPWVIVLQKLVPVKVADGEYGTEWIDAGIKVTTGDSGNFTFPSVKYNHLESVFRMKTQHPETGEDVISSEFVYFDKFQDLDLRWSGTPTKNALQEFASGTRFRGNIAYNSAPPSGRGGGEFVFSVTADGVTKEISRTKVSMNTTWRTIQFTHVDKNFFPKSNKATYSVKFVHSTAADKNFISEGEISLEVPFTKVASTISNSRLNGQTINSALNAKIDFSGSVSGGARKVELQRYDDKAKAWKVVRTASATSANGSAYGSFKHSINAGEGTASWRLYAPATATHAAIASTSTKVNRPAPTANVTISVSAKKTVPWIQRTANIYVSNGTTPAGNVALQRYDAGKKTWVTVSNHKVTKNSFSVNLPKGSTGSATSTQKYRAYYTPGNYYANKASSAVDVRWENPNKYTGQAKQYYDLMKGYCPAVTVEMGNLGGPWGLAYMSGNNESHIKIQWNIPGQHRKTVANHECAHVRQWMAGGNNYNGFVKLQGRLNQIYGTKGTVGLERNADCIASLMGPMSYWAYGDSCGTAAKKNAARTVLNGRIP